MNKKQFLGTTMPDKQSNADNNQQRNINNQKLYHANVIMIINNIVGYWLTKTSFLLKTKWRVWGPS